MLLMRTLKLREVNPLPLRRSLQSQTTQTVHSTDSVTNRWSMRGSLVYHTLSGHQRDIWTETRQYLAEIVPVSWREHFGRGTLIDVDCNNTYLSVNYSLNSRQNGPPWAAAVQIVWIVPHSKVWGLCWERSWVGTDRYLHSINMYWIHAPHQTAAGQGEEWHKVEQKCSFFLCQLHVCLRNAAI